MLRNRFRKKRGGGFMDDWNAGASSLKNNFETIKNKSAVIAAIVIYKIVFESI